MSLSFIHDFQKQLYSMLSGDRQIIDSIEKIYFGAVQDGKTPFLLITIQKAQDLSRHLEFIYSIDFQISAYAKDHNYQLLVKLADRVIKVISIEDNYFSGYVVAGIRVNNLQFDKAQDLVLNKLTINYKALIKKETYE